MISPEQLAEWERLSNESTEGPWLTYSQAKKVLNIHWNDWFSILAYNENGKPFILCSSNGAMTTDKAKEEARLKEGLPEPEGQTKCDMAFIAAAREAVPALITEVKSLQKAFTLLVRQHACFVSCPPTKKDCSVKACSPERRVKCWREAARKFVENE